MEVRLFAQQISSDLVQFRHALTTEKFPGAMERLVQPVEPIWRSDFDEHYTCEIVHQIPGFAERTLKLAELLVSIGCHSSQ